MTAKSYSYWIDTEEYQPFHSISNVFTAEECSAIIDIGTSTEHSTGMRPAVVVNDNEKVISNTIRRSEISWILSNDTSNRWIYDRIVNAVKEANTVYNFDLKEIENVQFSQYNATGEFYGRHVDMLYKNTLTRKLSITVQLSDPLSYTGGDLALYAGNDVAFAPRTQGTANFFPSYTLHEVLPVSQGVRYSLVAWINGPRFK